MKKTLISLSVGFTILLGAMMPALASASTLSTNQIQAVVSLLQAFGVDSTTITNVQQTLSGVQITPPTTATSTAALTAQAIGQLRLGDQGDRVKYLQTLLAADPSIYSGTISGYFGALTQAALKNYQRKHGLAPIGSVSSSTLKDLDDDLAQNPLGTENGDHKHLCAIVPPGHLIAPGWLGKNGGQQPAILPCQTLPPGIGDRNHGTTTPPVVDVTAPTISGAMVTNLASTSSTVSWGTNELSTSKVYFGTTTPLSLSAATNVSSAALTSSHTLNLSGLATSTAYYYVVESADASSNKATTTQASFTTLAI